MSVPFWVHMAALLIVALVALAVSLPLLRPARASSHPRGADPARLRWNKEKEMAYAAIKEAEFDYQMGKLSDEDYRALRAKYEQRALEALARLEEIERSGRGN